VLARKVTCPEAEGTKGQSESRKQTAILSILECLEGRVMGFLCSFLEP
jgi:hypothetical protein